MDFYIISTIAIWCFLITYPFASKGFSMFLEDLIYFLKGVITTIVELIAAGIKLFKKK